jgi:hypothetical protein
VLRVKSSRREFVDRFDVERDIDRRFDEIVGFGDTRTRWLGLGGFGLANRTLRMNAGA